MARTLQSIGSTEAGEIHDRIRELGPWFHNLHLPGGVRTAPDHPLGDFPRHKWALIEPHLPSDLSGWRALDIGCNAGYYSFELARRGADVVAIDSDPHYLRQARWASRMLGLAERVRFGRRTVYRLARIEQRFDLVLFLGVFYHLRYPQLALEAVARRVRRLLVFQSLSLPVAEPCGRGGLGFADSPQLEAPGWPKMSFVEHDFAGDPTNWWIPNSACVEALLRDAGLVVRERIDDIYLCAPTLEPVPAEREEEFREACGLGRERRT